jgi:hypothetical protein
MREPRTFRTRITELSIRPSALKISMGRLPAPRHAETIELPVSLRKQRAVVERVDPNETSAAD